MTTLDFNKIRDDFPNLAITVHGKPLAYLDNAATTFKPLPVLEALDTHYRRGVSNIHRGVHWLSEQATLAYEDVRTKVKLFLNAKDDAEIIFTHGTTESINLVALSLGTFFKAGDEILITHMEHHANIVPWQMLCERQGCVLKVASINDAGELDLDAFKNLLSDKTRIVAFTAVSNSLGTINPIKDLIKLARANGALTLVDAAQAVAHMPIDVQALDCDFLAFSGHKIFGPTGIGVLYGRKILLEKMPPVYGGGDMIASVTFEKTTYNVVPHKFEAGTPPIAEVIGLGAALSYVSKIGLAAISAREAELLAYGTKTLSAIPGLRLIGTAAHKAAILSFVLDGIHPHDVGSLLDLEGVAIRTGHHCTQPVMKRFGIPATARASLAFYNTFAEIDQLAAAIHKVREVFK
jgi:cysteine desulfurase/selenocysteine lyase